ncbi:MAG TPA: lipocalin-like domain-containing protein [Vicinamibacterales bacterium]
MKTKLLVLAALTVWLRADVAAQAQGNLVGTWKLVSATGATADGRVIDAPFGVHPTGFIIYSSDGTMTAMISHGGRKALSGDRISSPAPERAEAYATFFAYGGRYSVKGNQVIHHVEIASFPNWVGTDMVRIVKMSGDRLTLTTPALSVGGASQTTELTWERAK